MLTNWQIWKPVKNWVATIDGVFPLALSRQPSIYSEMFDFSALAFFAKFSQDQAKSSQQAELIRF